MANPRHRTFEVFRDQLLETVDRMNASLDSDGTWPGVLFLEVPDHGLVIAEMRSLARLSESDKNDLAARVLPGRIRRSKADRFAWVMPAWRHDVDPAIECLVVVAGEPRHTEAHVADVVRDSPQPRLGDWRGPTKNVQGIFAEPLARALLARPRPARRQRRVAPRSRKPAGTRSVASSLGVAATARPLLTTCPDCETSVGEPHRQGCDVERCTLCGDQQMLCQCDGHDERAAAWDGEWPGAAACRALGWWAIRAQRGWRPCPPGTPNAIEDVNRLTFLRQVGYDGLYRSGKETEAQAPEPAGDDG